MDFFFVEYRDPLFGLIVLTILVFTIASSHYIWCFFANKDQKNKLDRFVKKFEINSTHQELLKNANLSIENLNFLAEIFTKSGEFEKAVGIYLIALQKTNEANQKEYIFFSLAKVYLKAGFLERSVESLLNALKIRSRNKESLKLLKIVYLKLKQYDKVLEVLECLFELGENIYQEKALIKALKIQASSKNKEEKIRNILALSKDNESVLRLCFSYDKDSMDNMPKFENIIDLLENFDESFNIKDSKYHEFFYAKNIETSPIKLSNEKFKILKILNDNGVRAKLSFTYICDNCKNQSPLFFYHCPVCYEFNTCKIYYEVKT
ncbi:hypothetical protein CINS5915_05205 [Campylobacter insulaenigrae]|uniref:Tetratricopeptide repeat protein n=2 Tax=Campylobacter insulaenigrae TaxID=260714 RepID=A0A0A8H2S0_9BACT|nr:hypothetical protein [Campylobacter insulaenigrae]AJC88381.1 tetratricopeptide repeat protein [Campylobacter insulaenigrae NCTC 12927]MCR6571368.1 hypothetical protein [Campylobacter insulaenigrae]MCR6572809.1 hypothetical protein [Campylobacter insulaenigrae]MCR6574169.1 hypothetical protein [Campylobacter insulaenigrae]MCR6575760.1 hypothetical protein [Campylobacter insulaenigrae]